MFLSSVFSYIAFNLLKQGLLLQILHCYTLSSRVCCFCVAMLVWYLWLMNWKWN